MTDRVWEHVPKMRTLMGEATETKGFSIVIGREDKSSRVSRRAKGSSGSGRPKNI